MMNNCNKGCYSQRISDLNSDGSCVCNSFLLLSICVATGDVHTHPSGPQFHLLGNKHDHIYVARLLQYTNLTSKWEDFPIFFYFPIEIQIGQLISSLVKSAGTN